MDMEDAIEQAYWDFDSERKRTGAERDAFKGQFRGMLKTILKAKEDEAYQPNQPAKP